MPVTNNRGRVRWGRRIVRLMQILSLLSIIPAAIFFLIEQRASRRAAQVQYSMALIEQANTGEILALRTKLAKPWYPIDLGALASSRPSDAAMAKLKRDTLEGAAIDDADVIQMADFFRTGLLCRKTGVCAQDVFDTFFCEETRGFYSLYDLRLAPIAGRINRPDAFVPLAEYAEQCTIS